MLRRTITLLLALCLFPLASISQPPAEEDTAVLVGHEFNLENSGLDFLLSRHHTIAFKS